MSEAYTQIRAGLEQAIAHAAGESVEVVLHYPATATENGEESNSIFWLPLSSAAKPLT